MQQRLNPSTNDAAIFGCERLVGGQCQMFNLNGLRGTLLEWKSKHDQPLEWAKSKYE